MLYLVHSYSYDVFKREERQPNGNVHNAMAAVKQRLEYVLTEPDNALLADGDKLRPREWEEL